MSHFKKRWTLEKANAHISLRMAIRYFMDLQAFRAGDTGRFVRMVDAKGKQFSECSENEWTDRIRRCCSDALVLAHFPLQAGGLLRRAVPG